jgi:hypothetical protein
MTLVRQVEAAVEFEKPSQRWFAELERQFNGDIMKGTGRQDSPGQSVAGAAMSRLSY